MVKLKNNTAPFYFCLVILGLFFNAVSAQDLEKFKTADPLQATGNVGWNQIFYNTNRATPARQAQTWVFNGNVNFKFFDIINAPFSFNYSNLGNQFTQPNFNQSSLHPSYKWIALHLGTISQSWGSYTVNGHVFRGAGLELTPGKWNIALFYGRFQKANQPDTNAVSLATATYKRMGKGIRIGFAGNKTQISGQLFHAADEIHSIHIPAYSNITPMQNICAGMQLQQQISKQFRGNADIGISRLTADSRVANTTSQNTALKLGLQYAIRFLQISAGYEKVDPNYRTLGAYYFNNDLQNITAGLGLQLWKGKLNVNGTFGKQHDNLDSKKQSQMTRTVGSANVNFQPSTKFGINAGYNNFLSYTNLRPFTDYQNTNNPYLAWDTLNFRQIAENMQLGTHISLVSDTVKSFTLNLNGTRQLNIEQTGEKKSTGNAFYNFSMGLSYLKLKSGLSISAAANAGQMNIGTILVQNISPVFSISKPFYKKQIQTQFSISKTLSYANQKSSGNVLNLRCGARYTYHKKHNFSLNIQYLNRKDSPITNPYAHPLNVSDITVFLSYNLAGELLRLGRR